MRCVRVLIVSLCAFALLAPAALAQWPTTCVELNDIVEAHLGNDENVGIYQRVFGDQAEQACRRDHVSDVRRSFYWTIDTGPSWWMLGGDSSSPSIAIVGSDRVPSSGATLGVICYFDTKDLRVFIDFTDTGKESRPIDEIRPRNDGLPGNTTVELTYVLDYAADESSMGARAGEYHAPIPDSAITEWWRESIDKNIIYAPDATAVSLARKLVNASTFDVVFSTLGSFGRESSIAWFSPGVSIHNPHLVLRVLEDCGF